MRRLFFVLFALASPLLWTCSENDTPAVVDRSEPEVRIFYPQDTEPTTFVVNDSIHVYFGAQDLGPNGQPVEPTKVELWFSRPGSASDTTDRVLIGTAGRPISIDQVPERDSIRAIVRRSLPAGWSLYTREWFTGPTPLPPIGTPINTGTDVQLFAVAYDAADNVGRTPGVIRIRITNFGDDIGPPTPRFTINPQSGSTATIFVFDASASTDRIDPVHKISTRWDFDGNPSNGWDIDWDADARADEPQSWQYVVPRTYHVILQVHNSYLPGVDSTATRELTVTSIGGDPRPPEVDNYCDVPAGTYVLGDTSYVSDGRTYQTDAIERPIHQVLLNSAYRIEKTEVTNRLYLNYLRAELFPDTASIVYREGERLVYSWDRAQPDAPRVVYFDPSLSEIYYDLDNRTFAIRPGFEDHPVTGVTWFGASAYALAYGLRLPTEAEWEVAARGANDAWNYPFVDGTELTQTAWPYRVNYYGSRSGADPFTADTGPTTPRGFYNGQVYQGFQTQDTPSAFGAYDMAGNVAEWVGDWLPTGPPFYPGQLDTDPQGATSGTHRVVRGGSYLSSRSGVRCTARKGSLPTECFASVGFRTAYIPPAPPPGR
jgi:formylglycine-generating enzyme required for sulfatase activity